MITENTTLVELDGILERKTGLREDWLRHWPAARDFFPPGKHDTVRFPEKTPHSDVAVLAGLAVVVRRIRRRRLR